LLMATDLKPQKSQKDNVVLATLTLTFRRF